MEMKASVAFACVQPEDDELEHCGTLVIEDDFSLFGFLELIIEEAGSTSQSKIKLGKMRGLGIDEPRFGLRMPTKPGNSQSTE